MQRAALLDAEAAGGRGNSFIHTFVRGRKDLLWIATIWPSALAALSLTVVLIMCYTCVFGVCWSFERPVFMFVVEQLSSKHLVFEMC